MTTALRAIATDRAPLIEALDLHKRFVSRRGWLGRETLAAVRGVSFVVWPGEIVGLVGESGSGKTTVGRMLLRLTEPTAGRVRFEGTELTALSRRALRPFRRKMQIVFQDPFDSLNGRMTIAEILGEALEIHGLAQGRRKRAQIAALLDQVGLSASQMDRFPHAFSGGQRQRIGIARALAVQPRFILADEPVSALDVSVQAQIVNLILDLRDELNLTLLFISHDLSLVKFVADRILVMYFGKIVESGTSREIAEAPIHPYTEALLSAAPQLDGAKRPARVLLRGDPPSVFSPPSGCAFRTRCPLATRVCAETDPPLVEVAPGRHVACLHRAPMQGPQTSRQRQAKASV